MYFSLVVTQNYQQSRVPSISYLAVVAKRISDGRMFSFSRGEIDLEVVYLDEAVISCLWNSSTSKKLAFGVVVWKSLANSFLKIWKKDFPWEYLLRIGECSILQSLSYLGYDDPYFCCFLVWREIGSSDCECWYLPYQQRPSSRVSSAPKTAGYSLCTVG